MMNEKSKNLYAEAVSYAFDQRFTESPDGPRPLQEVINEKFAELIVSECVQVCADRGKMHDGLYSAWAADCAQRIEKHFGVE